MPYMAPMALAIVHHPRYRIDTTKSRRFPVGKLKRLAEIIEAENLEGDRGFQGPEPVAAEQIALAHHPDYVEQVLTGCVPTRIEKEIGFPIHEHLVRPYQVRIGGTLLAARLALAEGLACNTAGGGHHARRLLRLQRRRRGRANS